MRTNLIIKSLIMIKKIILTVLITLIMFSTQANEKTYKMVFVPASEKGDENDYTNLISITEKLTGFKIETIKVTDYNAAVEAMRAGRAHIAWYGGKTYVKAAEIANAEAFAAGVRDQGLNVVDIGLASTDMCYFASGHFDFPAAMVTASHNENG